MPAFRLGWKQIRLSLCPKPKKVAIRGHYVANVAWTYVRK
jgi:hypothetical protein